MATLLPEKIYNHLRRKLLAGEYHAGSRLDYKRISTEMGVSTTPVREAMGKLASEGLVDLIPRAGAIVRQLGEQEAVQLYGVREAIETYAAAKAAEKITDARLKKLQSLLERMGQLIKTNAAAGNRVMIGEDLAEFLESDLAFHMTIIDAAGNPRLSKLAVNSHTHSRIFGVERFGHDHELLREADEIHWSIYRALQERDAAEASKLISRHINRSLELTLNHVNHERNDSWWKSDSTDSTGSKPLISA